MVDITGPIVNMVNEIVSACSVIIAAIIILIIGWIIGRVAAECCTPIICKG